MRTWDGFFQLTINLNRVALNPIRLDLIYSLQLYTYVRYSIAISAVAAAAATVVVRIKLIEFFKLLIPSSTRLQLFYFALYKKTPLNQVFARTQDTFLNIHIIPYSCMAIIPTSIRTLCTPGLLLLPSPAVINNRQVYVFIFTISSKQFWVFSALR